MAFRATVHGRVHGVGFREATRQRALELGLRGWVRNTDEGTVELHAEGSEAALAILRAFLGEGPRGAGVTHVEMSPTTEEGHEQFAIRGVSAGVFVIQRHQARSLHYDLRLEVNGVLRSWAVPKEPSMDPSVKRLAIEQPDHELSYATHESDNVEIWDHGTYEQGGRVPWPEALERGHAVFVLHGQRLQGGFALQRTDHQPSSSGGPGSNPERSGPTNWLLIKRREGR
jgi:DNA ligase D-like protein (predicted 3'-phosphoesterase)